MKDSCQNLAVYWWILAQLSEHNICVVILGVPVVLSISPTPIILAKINIHVLCVYIIMFM